MSVLPPIPAPTGKTITQGLAARQLEKRDPFVPEWEAQIPPENAQGCVPGYRGFIRGEQHFYGATAGAITRRANAHEFGPDSAGNPVDELPRGISEPVGSRGAYAPGDKQNYRVPGYAGYVPGYPDTFASTFGSATHKLVDDLGRTLSKSPVKPRMLATVTTEMLNGRDTVFMENRSAGSAPPCANDVFAREHEGLGHVPGYAGFVRGAQHFHGSTYSDMTRVSKDYDYSKPVVDGRQPVTSSKGSILGAMPLRPEKRDQTNINNLPNDRPPGYSGHVPLAKFEFANTFGNTIGICTEKPPATQRPAR